MYLIIGNRVEQRKKGCVHCTENVICHKEGKNILNRGFSIGNDRDSLPTLEKEREDSRHRTDSYVALSFVYLTLIYATEYRKENEERITLP